MCIRDSLPATPKMDYKKSLTTAEGLDFQRSFLQMSGLRLELCLPIRDPLDPKNPIPDDLTALATSRESSGARLGPYF